MKTYTISQLAKITGITTRTLRHYDQIKLLSPKRINDANYRLYTSSDLDRLQQILIYKEMDVPLSQIKEIFDLDKTSLEILTRQKEQLTTKIDRIKQIINTIDYTILSIKGEYRMKDEQKFEGLKEKLIEENDLKYKDEVIKKYGKTRYEQSKEAFRNFSEEQFNYFNSLNDKLSQLLIKLKDDKTNKSLREDIAITHSEWIKIAWGGNYDKESHFNLVEMYVSDPRFRKFYDKDYQGLAILLKECVQEYLSK